MTQEEKAKRYDEAIEKAGKIHNEHKAQSFDVMLKVFPELKEGEDERIRKELLEHCKNQAEPYIQTGNECPQIQSWIAWLEKQGEHSNFRNKIQIGDKVTRNRDGVLVNLSQLNRIAKKDEKQGNNADKIIERAKTEKQRVLLTETNGDANIDWDTRSLQDVKLLLEYGLDYIKKLKKQSEQKPIDKIQLGKKYKCVASPRYSAFMKGEIYKPEDKFLCSLMNFCSDCFEPIEDGKQIPADKVEPKFKIGDFIVNDYCRGKVVELTNDAYLLDTGQGIPFSCEHNIHLWTIQNAMDGDKIEPKFKVGDWVTNGRYTRLIVGINSDCPYYMFKDGTSKCIKDIDKKYYLWTIQDAKDGDVLYECNEKKPFIFKELKTKHIGDIASYCDIFNGVFNPNEDNWTTLDIVPATKEQRDQLEKAMANYGYKWNKEEHKLEKI